MRLLLSLLTVAAASNTNYNRRERDAMRRVRAPDALPQEIFRESVEPQKGGKVPESAHMRIELNKIDAAGLDNAEAVRMMAIMEAQSMTLPERAADLNLIDTGSGYQPGASPAIKLRPEYHPAPVPVQAYGPTEPVYQAPEPVYQAPIGPVMLEKRPYDVKSVQPLPISVSETYTSFDCRTKPYQGRHYADPEAGCEIYHFCHDDGKQDTYHCGYGTLFNEYIGTCDYKNNVHCTSGEGYAAPPPAPLHAAAPPSPPPHVSVPFHQPAPYHQPAQYQQPAPYQPPTGYQQDPFQSFTAFG